MVSLSTDSKEVWIKPRRQSQHRKLSLEANTQPSTNSSAWVSCAHSEIPRLLSRLPAFSTSSSFPRVFSSLCCIAALKSSGDKHTDNSTNVHSPHRQAQTEGGEKDKNQQTNEVPVCKQWGLVALSQLH